MSQQKEEKENYNTKIFRSTRARHTIEISFWVLYEFWNHYRWKTFSISYVVHEPQKFCQYLMMIDLIRLLRYIEANISITMWSFSLIDVLFFRCPVCIFFYFVSIVSFYEAYIKKGNLCSILCLLKPEKGTFSFWQRQKKLCKQTQFIWHYL